MNCARVLKLAAAFVFLVAPLYGQTSVPALPGSIPAANRDDDPKAIFELGAATGWELGGGAAAFAPNLAAEITPIDHWLELEAGVSPFYSRKHTEWDTDLLFKKPWTISKKAEFMLGIGPEWI